MKLLITGGAGHIGSFFLRKLLDSCEIAKLILIDDFSAERYVSIIGCIGHPKLVVVRQDFREFNDFGLVADVDFVIHMAAITDAASSFERRDRVEQTNYGLTSSAVELCESLGKPLIFFSSTSVYGSSQAVVNEDQPESLNPQSPYAETKLREEALIRSKLQNQHIILRLGTIFGFSPGIRFHTAVNKFCLQACLGEPLTVWSTARDQVRPYLALEDCYEAVRFLMDKGEIEGGTFNVLTGNYSVSDVLNAISSNGLDIKIQFVDSEIMNQLSYEVSSQKLRSLGFSYTGNLNVSIKNTLDILSKGHF